jgi:type VI protein secretion system component VasF
MTGNDRDLRDSFAALRGEQEARAPEFVIPPRPVSKHGRRNASARLLAALACVAAMMAAVLWLRTPAKTPRRTSDAPIASITNWKSPTNFLLDTPGRELLRTVPAIGVWPADAMAANLRRRPRQISRQVRHKEERS